MKNPLYLLGAAAIAVTAFSSCAGHEEYDAYVASLKAQPAAIDTISSAASYAARLDTIAAKAFEFQQLGIKLNETQKAELEALSIEIQTALTNTYNRLAQTPMPLAAELCADAPVSPDPADSAAVALN